MLKRAVVVVVLAVAACGSSGPHPARIELHLSPMPYAAAVNHLAVGDEVWISAYAYDATGAMLLPADGSDVIAHVMLSVTPAGLAEIGTYCGIPTLHALSSGTVTIAGAMPGAQSSMMVTIDPPGVLGVSPVIPLPACR